MRRQGLTRGAVALVVAGLLYAAGAGLAARVALGGATVVLLAALLSPDRFYLGVGRGLELLGRGIGRGLAILLLSPVFFLFVLPFGLLLRSGRRDRLERRFDRSASTYWHLRRDSPRGRAHFDRSF